MEISAGSTVTETRDNFAIRALELPEDQTEFSLSITLSDDGTLNDQSFSDSETPTATVVTPRELLGGNRNISRVGTAVFANDALFQQTDFAVRSVVLTFDVYNNGEKVVVNNLASPIIFTFVITRNIESSTEDLACTFWDESTSKCSQLRLQHL